SVLDQLHCHGFSPELMLISSSSWLASRMREMEALEKKDHRSLAKAKPLKPSYNYNAPSRHKRSKSDLEEKNAKDALHSSQKASHNHPKLVSFCPFSCAPDSANLRFFPFFVVSSRTLETQTLICRAKPTRESSPRLTRKTPSEKRLCSWRGTLTISKRCAAHWRKRWVPTLLRSLSPMRAQSSSPLTS
uniref:Uncharacterized protein n=1 Tax=Aegilops tauschii subsp. strangulata TaxID=200361 RepID=A0A453BNY5_AEGTS